MSITNTMPTGQQEIPDQIREIRGRAKLSRPELAQLLGVSLVAIHQWERSINTPSNKQKQRIAQLLTDIKLGRKIRPPSLVLQNESFASRGSTRGSSRVSVEAGQGRGSFAGIINFVTI
ncbi:MAG: helix-turn-helix transcriptional regulator [Candidatus Competibacteraceae bacterium]